MQMYYTLRPKGNDPTLANKSELDRNVNLVQWLNKRKVLLICQLLPITR